MGEFRAAHRYARALLGVALERDQLDTVAADCSQIEALLGGSREFMLFLRSPVINAQKKRRVVEEILGTRVGPTMLTFVVLLVTRNREALLPETIAEFFRLRDERMGIVNATASVAVPLTPAQERRLTERLEEATKKKVRMKYVQDATLRAGFMVRLGDTVWDASVRHELEQLRRLLAGGANSTE